MEENNPVPNQQETLPEVHVDVAAQTPMPKKRRSKLLLVLPISVTALIVLAGLGYLYYNSHIVQKPIATTKQQVVTDPYAGWQAYADTGTGISSGISIKYPATWHVDPTGTKSYGWSIVETTNTKNIITVNDIFGDGSKTAQQEWESCYLTDACLGSTGEKILSGSESTINGSDAYTAIMQTDYGTYHMTMIRGDKSTSNGIPYVWFTTYATEIVTLNIFTKIMNSAYFTSATSAAGYLEIKEWGVKVKIADADKLTYVIGGTPNGTSPNADAIVSWATLKLKDSITTNSQCQSLGYEAEQLAASASAAKDGQYTYGFSGVSNPCGNSALDTLRAKIVSELTKDAIQTE